MIALVAWPRAGRADDGCTGVTPGGGRFATCFDTGNRLSFTAGSDGFGGSVAVRHVVHFEDEPDLVWKLEHVAGDATHAAFEDRFDAVVYRGRYLRHARDGHIVLPLGVPKKIFLPFDIGALAEVGRLRWRPDVDAVTVGLVKTAALIDVSRTRGFKRRFAFGPVARWDLEATRQPRDVTGHVVAPFSMALANIFVESASGRTSGDLRVEAGSAWHSDTATWEPEVLADATVERIVLAVNDRPIALVLGLRYETATEEAIARVGARIVLFDRRDPRVRLDQLHRPARPAP